MGRVVPHSGSFDSKIWFIGEAPAQRELIEGEPFVGTSGMLLRRFMMQTGLDPTDYLFDNVYNERCPGDKLGLLFKQGEPNADVKRTYTQLTERIRKHRPNLVVCLGAIPLHLMTGFPPTWNHEFRSFTPLVEWRGFIWEHNEIPGQKLIGTYHPSYINREGYADHGIFLCDLDRIKRESEFPEIRRPKKNFIIKPTMEKLAEIEEQLVEEDKIITCDIEYVGSKLLCVGLTNSSEWAACIAMDSDLHLKTVRRILMSGIPINMQNAAFDGSILEWHYGIPTFKHIGYDTMLAAHALNIELPKDLGFLASIYTDQPQWKHMVDWDKIKKGLQSIEDVFTYNCIDVWVQHAIMEAQLAEDFPDRPDKQEVFEFEMALLNPLWEMSKRGMKVDPLRQAEYEAELRFDLKLSMRMLALVNGGKEVNVKSGDQVSEMLFDYLGMRPGQKSDKTKKPKTDDKTLSKLLGRTETDDQAEAIRLVREARRYRDLLSKFVAVPLDDDGRTRGMYNPGGTETGRLASKKFLPTGRGHQQQNIPVKGRHIIVPDTGLLFGSVDKERAESLVVAHLTNDPIMLEHHKPGADAHRLLAQLFYKYDSIKEVTKDQRVLFKQTRHAGNYMEGYMVFTVNVNQKAHITGVSITTKRAKEFIEWYRDVHTGLRPWWLSVDERLQSHHELTNLLGRSRTFFQRANAILPTAVAYVPQGTVGDLVNIALLNLSGVVVEKTKKYYPDWEEVPAIKEELDGLGFQLLNQVHDSIGFQFPPHNETRVRELVIKAMRVPLMNPNTFEPFYIGDEIKVGKSWGETS